MNIEEKIKEIAKEYGTTDRLIKQEIDKAINLVTPATDIYTNDVKKNELIGIVLSIRNLMRYKACLMEEVESLWLNNK